MPVAPLALAGAYRQDGAAASAMLKYAFLALACASVIVFWNEYVISPKYPRPYPRTFEDVVCSDDTHSLNLAGKRYPHGGRVVFHLHEGCFSRLTLPANETWRFEDIENLQTGDWLSFKCGTRFVPPAQMIAIALALSDNQCDERGLYQGKGAMVFTKK